MIRFKQIFKLPRYFIVVYMYQIKEGVTGQGQCSVIVQDGQYFSINAVKDNLTVGGEIESIIVLNAMELNKRDYKSYMEGSKSPTEENEKL